MEEVIQEKYLGDIISHDGKNMKSVMARVGKAVGITNQIMSILEEICFGPYNFEVAVTLRNALSISSMLCNLDAWSNTSNGEINKLDQILWRRILECPHQLQKRCCT